MAYNKATKNARVALKVHDGVLMHTVRVVTDTDAGGLADFDATKFVNRVQAVVPSLGFVPARATGTLTISGVVIDAETVTIGTKVFEFDTDGIVTAGRYRVDITGTSIKAAQTLTFTGAVADGQTVTVGGITFEFDNNGAVTGANTPVPLGTDLTGQNAVVQLVKAINATAGCTVTASAPTALTVTVKAKKGGVAGNAIAASETCANANWGAATLANGVDTTNVQAGNALFPVLQSVLGPSYFIEYGATNNIIIITAKTPGVGENATATTEACANAAFGAGTLTGGAATKAFYAVGYDSAAKKLTVLKITDGLAGASLAKLECDILIFGAN